MTQPTLQTPRKVSLVRRTHLGAQPVGDISIATEEQTYLLNGQTLVHNCPSNAIALTPNNKLSTPQGLIPYAQFIAQGGGQIENAPNETVEVSQVRTEGQKPVVEIEDEDGTIYTCTDDHPFMTVFNGQVVPMPVRDIFRPAIS